MTDLTPETIAHLRELDAARTQGEATLVGGGEYLLPFGIMVAPDEGGITDADAEWILAAANHMRALLDAVEERDQLHGAWEVHNTDCAAVEAEVSRLRAELAEREQEFIVWLVETVHYPFDVAFSTPPPVDQQRLADHWNHSDGWDVTPWEAYGLIADEVRRTALAPATQREAGE